MMRGENPPQVHCNGNLSDPNGNSEAEINGNARPPTLGSEGADDSEETELAKLRCKSVRTEVLAEKEKSKRRARCSDYPGLAFGSSVFSSNTMMKFSIIKNELHNIMNVQLRRAEGEVAALNRRIQVLDEELDSATAQLHDAAKVAEESQKMFQEEPKSIEEEEDEIKVEILDFQLQQAKLLEEEADRRYCDAVERLLNLHPITDNAS